MTAGGLDVATFGEVPMEPDLFLLALELASEQGGRRARELDLLVLAARAFSEYAGLEDGDPEVDADMIATVVGALACRLTALAEVVEANRIKPGTYPPEALAEAASAARLVSVKGLPAFQPLEFFARLERAVKEPRQ